MEASNCAGLTTDGCHESITIILNGSTFPLASMPVDHDKLVLSPSPKFSSPGTPCSSRDGGLVLGLNPSSRIPCRVVCVPVSTEVEIRLSGVHDSSGLDTGNHSESDRSHVTSSIFDVSSELVDSQLGIDDVIDGEVQLVTSSISHSHVEEPKKRKGGWPKGKKRKPDCLEIKAPKGPSTGYVLFLNERRLFYKESHPELPFTEVTKILGNEWSNLPSQEKQKFLERAEADKKRYREELKAYRQSDVYQSYMMQKQMRRLCDNSSELCSSVTPDLHLGDVEDEDSEELYCKVCDQLFSSLHNKKEHFYGRQHLQAVIGGLQKEPPANDNHSLMEDEPTVTSSPSSESLLTDGGISSSRQRPLSISDAVVEFLDMVHVREIEIMELQRLLQRAKLKNELLSEELLRLKEHDTSLRENLTCLKMQQTGLGDKLENLRMVPTLFGVINF